MNTSSLRKGFTLVEIMIVVVIIGLLAALAIPAFKKVRNNAIEKTLVNDARQLASAANQIASEQATTQVLFSEIASYVSGGKLSTGVLIDKDGANPTATFESLASSGAYFIIGTAATPYFSLGHPNFDRTLSSQLPIKNQNGTPSTSCILFDTNDGKVK